MKLTKRQLRRIIKEEKRKLLTESSRIVGGIGFHSHQTPKTNRVYNNGYRKPTVAEQHDPTGYNAEYVLYGAILNRDSRNVNSTLEDLEAAGVNIGNLSTEIESLAHGKWKADLAGAVARAKK